MSEVNVPEPPKFKNLLALDPFLTPFSDYICSNYAKYWLIRKNIELIEGSLGSFSMGYKKFGFRKCGNFITYREWAPCAKKASLVGDFNNWDREANPMQSNEYGVWEVTISKDTGPLHLSNVKFIFQSTSGDWKYRIPAWIRYARQNRNETIFSGVYYDPPNAYQFKNARPTITGGLRIYEAHVGICSPEPRIATYEYFTDYIVPHIKKNGYNAIQLMAILEHAYYGSFGYQVTNFFAPSSRFGTPEDLKKLIDTAHENGIIVLLDLVHSHASKNVEDGLNMFDGSDYCYFHEGPKGVHSLWDSRLFNYGHWEVLRFLLSNLRWWMDEFMFDGFRFDGVTSMLYKHHGIGFGFSGDYHEYFGESVDEEAVVYLMLANAMLHEVYPLVITIAEDVSGIPALCRPVEEGGLGFDYRMAMAVPDKWIQLLKENKDEDWNMGNIVHTLTNRRYKEKTVCYCESHDQALVGDKTLAFWLMDKEM
ncbi:hypothetical protein Zmor_027113 [Zophobas morio]|uniref:Glycosyl hydrolase family 13 catalytic domain-containing protein n=1 Tax=Zophobas morio TaxID=2755281 RepID=A0AA38HL06_9CUCU|nr:hypothetical protein Zmor_027113 [Zophobas morio]